MTRAQDHHHLHVAELWRYPVKSMAGERLVTAELRLDGIPGDRALYVVDADGDQFFGGQPAELAALVPGSTYARFTQAEGASFHCQPLAREITEQRMLDWMDEQLR